MRIAVVLAVVFLLASGAAADWCELGWSNDAAPIPQARFGSGGGIAGGKIVVFGGEVAGEPAPLDDTWVYDPDTDTWSAGAKLPVGLAGFGYAVAGGFAYAVAGRTDAETLSDVVYRYDVDGDAWETFVEPYPLQVYGLTCGADGDEAIYCVGGTANGTVERDEVYQLEPVPDGPWTARDPLPDDRIFGNLTYHGGFLYATGGWTHFSQTFIYDLTAGAWSGGDQMNKGRQQALVVSAGGQLWGAAGGDGWTPVTTDEFYQFVDGAHAPHGDWTSTGTAIGIPVVGPVAAYHPSFGVFVIGGRDGASADRADNQLWQICVPDVDLVAPATGPAGTSLTVSGRFFQEQGTAELFGADKTVYALDDLAVVDAQTITATVPADLADGLYGLRVIGEKDQTTEVEDAFEVLSDADDDSADDDTDDVDDDATDDDVSDDDADDDDAADDDDNDDDGGRCGC